MTITHSEIRNILSQYLDRYPNEVSDMAFLFHALDADHDITSRTEFRSGHVTAGAVVLDNKERVLSIRHKTLDTWLLPGGHLEHEDPNLLGASLREMEEETGIPRHQIMGSPTGDGVPLDIDIHKIPANPAKAEPEHHHFDFRYVHRIEDASVHLQFDEVTDFAWHPISNWPTQRLAVKLRPEACGVRARW